MYKNRIKKPIDVIKQPWLDFERAISFVLFQLLKNLIRPRTYPADVKKVLLIRRNRLGDAVNVLPVIEAIKQHQPNVEIHVLANQYSHVIFQHNAVRRMICRVDSPLGNPPQLRKTVIGVVL